MGLYGLWLLSLWLAGAALLIMVSLMAARTFAGRRKRRSDAERRRLIPILLGSDIKPGSFRRANVSSVLLADLAVELIQMVRGADKERLTAVAVEAGVPQRLLKQLRSRSSRDRLGAVESLAEFRFEQTVSALHGALDDRNADVRIAAAMSLGSMGHAPPAGELIRRLGIGTRESSLLTIGLFEEIAAARPEEIRAVIEDPASPGLVKAAAIESLSASSDYSLVPTINRLALEAGPASEELPRYLLSLAQFGHPAGIPAVDRALAVGAPAARAAACEAVGRIGVVEAAGRLADLLDDEEWWVRFRAGEALARLGKSGRETLARVAREGSPVAARAAALTMAERGIAA
jgi:HEAT repeat protein